MARYYRRRSRKRNNGNEGVLGLLALGVLAFIYTGADTFMAEYGHLLPLAMAVGITVILLIAGFVIYRMRRAKHIYDSITVADVDTMEGLEFERYLADLLHKRGFTGIKLTERFDYGIDIIAMKDGLTWGIQAKRHKNLVKAEAVRQTYTAMKRYKCDRAMVVTSSVFSNPAKILAQDNNITLVDRPILSKWIYEANRKAAKPIEDNRGAIL